MSVALPRTTIGASPQITGFLAPHTPDAVVWGSPASIGSPANDNLRKLRPLRPGPPWGPRPPAFGYRPGVSPVLLAYGLLRDRLEGWAAYEFGQLLRGITYIARPNIANSPGWHLAADCANGPGNFMGSFADPVYCGPLVSEPTPGGILEDPTSYNIKFYQFHPDLGLGEWRFHELWSAVKWDGVTLYPPPAVVYDVAAMPLADPWPWNRGWNKSRLNFGWSFPLENAESEVDVPAQPKPRKPRTDTDGVVVVPPVTPSPPSPVFPVPPGGGRKEVKLKLTGQWVGLGWGAANAFSEVADFVGALEKGLPPKLRARPVWVNEGTEWNWTRNLSGRWHKEMGYYRQPTPLERAQAIYRNWSSMNWTAAVGAVAGETATDVLYGKVGRAIARGNQAAGRPIGYQAGPWDRPPQPRLSF